MMVVSSIVNAPPTTKLVMAGMARIALVSTVIFLLTVTVAGLVAVPNVNVPLSNCRLLYVPMGVMVYVPLP